MYLEKTISNPRANFVYKLEYDDEKYSLVFKINEKTVDFFKNVNPANLYLRYAIEKLNAGNFENDILKNFGFGNASKNIGIDDGRIKLLIPVANGVTYIMSHAIFVMAQVSVMKNLFVEFVMAQKRKWRET